MLNKIINFFKTTESKQISKYIPIDKLVPGKYYKCYYLIEDDDEDDTTFYYYKFKDYNNGKINFYNFRVVKKFNKFRYENSVPNLSIGILIENYTLEEADINDIAHFLPDSNLDKKAYFRRKKIKYLLE